MMMMMMMMGWRGMMMMMWLCKNDFRPSSPATTRAIFGDLTQEPVVYCSVLLGEEEEHEEEHEQ